MVFKRFSDFDLSLKLKKCSFAKKSCECFGYKVDIEGFTPLEDRVNKLKQLAMPQTKKQLKSSLAAMAYYRNFFKNFSQLTAELYRMTGDKYDFCPNDQLKQEWYSLLHGLSDQIKMTAPRFNGSFELITDASTKAIGCVLHEYHDGVKVIIACDSKTLSEPQRRLPPSQLELLAVATFFRKLESIYKSIILKLVKKNV